MDIAALSVLLGSCLPFLMKLGGTAAGKVAESAGSAIGPDAWETAKKIWNKLQPKLVAKEDAKIAAEQLAAKPESEARKAVFQEELEALLKENPDLAETISQIIQESPTSTTGTQINQTVANNDGQVMGQMMGGSAIGQFRGSVQGGINQ